SATPPNRTLTSPSCRPPTRRPRLSRSSSRFPGPGILRGNNQPPRRPRWEIRHSLPQGLGPLVQIQRYLLSRRSRTVSGPVRRTRAQRHGLALPQLLARPEKLEAAPAVCSRARLGPGHISSLPRPNPDAGERIKTAPSGTDYELRLSSFVVTFAHSLVCLVKAKRLGARSDDDEAVVHYAFMADVRGRLKPPLPANYLGNCVLSGPELIQVRPLVAEGGIGFAAERISKMIDHVEGKDQVVGGDRHVSTFAKDREASRGVFIGIAGSPRFHVYGADFGWGKPKYVEVTSIDRTVAYRWRIVETVAVGSRSDWVCHRIRWTSSVQLLLSSCP
ncbi:unnamed protein product, partial [Linum tenue]